MRRSLWTMAAAVLISAVHVAAAHAETEACTQAYDLTVMGLKDYQDPMLSAAVQGVRSHDLARDIAAAMDSANSADDAVRLALEQAQDQDALAEASLKTANELYSGVRLKMTDLAAQPLGTKCASAYARAVCSAMIARWEAQRMRQQATATPCYWDPSLAVAAPKPAAVPPPAPASVASVAPPVPSPRAAPLPAPPVPPTASGPADDAARLNSSVVQTSQAIDARNDAQAAAYKAARAQYEAELAQQKAEAAEAQRKHAAEMDAWKAQVKACNAGDYQRCTK